MLRFQSRYGRAQAPSARPASRCSEMRKAWTGIPGCQGWIILVRTGEARGPPLGRSRPFRTLGVRFPSCRTGAVQQTGQAEAVDRENQLTPGSAEMLDAEQLLISTLKWWRPNLAG